MGQQNRKVICAGCYQKFNVLETSLYRKKRFCGNNSCKLIIDSKVKNSNYRKQQRKLQNGTFRAGVNPGLRTQVLDRDSKICKLCHHGIDSKKMQIHHIIPLSDGGDDTINNLITLCAQCHSDVHKEGYHYYVNTFKSYTKEMEKAGWSERVR